LAKINLTYRLTDSPLEIQNSNMLIMLSLNKNSEFLCVFPSANLNLSALLIEAKFIRNKTSFERKVLRALIRP